MKTLLIAAAAAATIAALGAAVPASAQTWDHSRVLQTQYRPVEQRYDRFVSPWEIRRIQEQRRAEERRRLEWLRRHHEGRYEYRDSGYGYRDSGYGYRR